MAFVFSPPLAPMLARGAKRIPTGDGLLYEPKWDGFRTLVFRDGDELYLQSRDSKPMLRYFPELVEPLRAHLPVRCVVDGELVVARGEELDFDALQQRIHPARSRIEMLASKTPAAFVAFDLLALGDDDLRETPFGERRAALERVLAGAAPPIHLTPATREAAVAQDWFERFEGAGLDGVIAKPTGDTYHPGKRRMVKVKHERTLDCALAGFRWHKHGPGTMVGSLILGLFDDDGRMHQIGVAASFSKVRRAEFAAELEPLREGAWDNHPWADWARAQTHEVRRAGVGSRWSGGKDLSWEPVRLERSVEVGYNHLTKGRLRHPAKFKRWRLDKEPQSCTFGQIEVTPAYELQRIFGGG